MIKRGIIRKYRDLLPAIAEEHIVTLGEGDTPLIRAVPLEKMLRDMGVRLNVFLKHEGLNPTCSFKDRGMTLAISKAKEQGVRRVICASTGNTASSAAAYAAAAGMECIVYGPAGSVAGGKIAQMLIYGAKMNEIQGSFDDALREVFALAKQDPSLQIVNSSNEYRLHGQKTAAYEVCDDLLDAYGMQVDYHCIPVGNGGNITAYWMGYRDYYNLGNIDRLPNMFGFQAEGAAPIVRGQVVEHPETIASAIKIGNPVHWNNALEAGRSSKGGIFSVSDREILRAYEFIAERIPQAFCEPASAASVAGLIKLAAEGRIEFRKFGTAVCTLTGHGLKDINTAMYVVRREHES